MPKYLVEMHDGRKFQVEADSQPSEDEILQHLGGQPASPHNTKPPAAEDFIPKGPEGSAIGRFAKGAWDNLNPIEGLKAVGQAASDPVGTLFSIADSQANQFKKAKADYDQGRYSEMIGHGAAGLLPFIGPAAANAGEAIGSGDIAGGLGQSAGLLGSVLGIEKFPQVAGSSVKKVLGKGAPIAERIINSNVKPPPSLVGRNPGVNIPRVILDEGFSPGFKGVEQGRVVSKDLADLVSSLADEDAKLGKKYPLDSLDKNLTGLRDRYSQNPAGAADVGQVQNVIDELYGNDRYARDVTQTTMTPMQSAILGPNGQPITKMVPQTNVTGRKLVPQDAPTINQMKRQIYEENPAAYGERKGARIQAEKAEGSALKRILDDNVGGVQAVNARNAGVITARKALNKMGVREANKYPLGLMDLVAMAGAAGGHLTAGPLGAIPAIAAVALKHPTTAFPIARGFDRVAKGAATAGKVAQVGTAAAVAGKLVDNGIRKLTKDELKDRLERQLAFEAAGQK